MQSTGMTNSEVGNNGAAILTALGLSVGAAVSLGFSRFAYALLLPPMRDSLHWSYVEAGGMNTANAIGYIFGAAAAAWFSKRLGIRAAFLLSLLISAFALLGSGFVDTYRELATLRAIGGFSTAILFIVGASLAGCINPGTGHKRSALLVALYITGVGTGIVISGLVVPPILARTGPIGWQSGWIWMGAIALLSLIPAATAARAIPPQAARDSGTLPWRETLFLGPSILSYGLYGGGYVSYMTFIIVLVRQTGGEHSTAVFWVVLGLASALGTLLWGRILPRLHDARGLAVVSVVAMIGALPVLLQPTLPATFLSAIIFGGSFMAGPAAVAILSRKIMAPHLATAAIAVLTISFAVGQAIGPVLSGYISDVTGSIGSGLWIAPSFLVLAAIIAPFQRTRQAATLEGL